jgi:hypothetical protein
MSEYIIKPEDTTFEMCPHCSSEVEINASKPSPCPECGIVILPCSTCYDVQDNKCQCDWSPEGRCWRFEIE